MTLSPGTRRLGPADADLLLMTTAEGPMARMGHELVLVVGRWDATVTIGDAPERSSLHVVADLTSLSVRGNRDPARTVPDKDRAEIIGHAAKALQAQKYAEAAFTSTSARGTWNAVTLRGDLTLHGQTHPQALTVVTEADFYTLTGQIRQSGYGIKPFAIMMGALKVGDVVDVRVSARL